MSSGTGQLFDVSTLHPIEERSLPSHFYPQQNDEQQICLVPCDEIVDGGPPPDGIPAIEDPKFYSVEDANTILDDNDIIMGVLIDGTMYGFPYEILNFHEIVNQKIQDTFLAITYCPLTGTGIPYHTGQSTVGTSGNLYENNLVYYDRDSDSYWSQMMGLSIKGDRIGDSHQQSSMIETKWWAFSTMYPNAQILTRDTGHTRNYDSYPYSTVGGGDYRETHTIIFDTAYDRNKQPDNWYHPKDLTLVLDAQNNTILVPFKVLDMNSPMLINQNETDLVILFDKSGRLAQPFVNDLDGEMLDFTRVSNDNYLQTGFGLNVYEDQFGNIWNMKGEVIEGPNTGSTLKRYVNSYNAFWFAAISFFPGATLYSENEVISLTGENQLGEYTDDSRLNFSILSSIALLVPILIKRRDE